MSNLISSTSRSKSDHGKCPQLTVYHGPVKIPFVPIAQDKVVKLSDFAAASCTRLKDVAALGLKAPGKANNLFSAAQLKMAFAGGGPAGDQARPSQSCLARQFGVSKAVVRYTTKAVAAAYARQQDQLLQHACISFSATEKFLSPASCIRAF